MAGPNPLAVANTIGSRLTAHGSRSDAHEDRRSRRRGRHGPGRPPRPSRVRPGRLDHRGGPPARVARRPARPLRAGRRRRRGRDGAPPRGPRRRAELRHLLLQRAGDARRPRGPRPLRRPRRPVPRLDEAVRAARGVPRAPASRRSSAWARRPASRTSWPARSPTVSTRVEAVHVRVGCIDRSASGPLPVPYALDTVLDEFALEPMVFENGAARPVPPMSGAETIDFPPPVGRAEAIYTLHSEVAMFPRSFPGLRDASFKVAFEPEFVEKVRFLVELGFASREKARGGRLAARGAPRRRRPPDRARGPSPGRRPPPRRAAGRKDGRAVSRRAEMTVTPHAGWGLAAGSVDTGVPLSIAGQLLASREISRARRALPRDGRPARALLRDARAARHARPLELSEPWGRP